MEKTAILPEVPERINMDLMSDDELRQKLQRGYEDIEKGNVQDSTILHRILEQL